MQEAELFAAGRGSVEVSRARQIAMYLMHTSLSLTHREIASAFGRDRTTVAHACRAVEDERDDIRFDIRVATLEAVIEPVAPLLARERAL